MNEWRDPDSAAFVFKLIVVENSPCMSELLLNTLL
jgi:hypothetical protein